MDPERTFGSFSFYIVKIPIALALSWYIHILTLERCGLARGLIPPVESCSRVCQGWGAAPISGDNWRRT